MSKLPSPAETTALLRQRSSIYPPMYTAAPIERTIIEEMLENASWAPNHRKTEPWRFKVFRGAARQRLADFMSSWYRANTPIEAFKEKKYQKLQMNPVKADTVIAICMQRDPQESLPEWEELAAVAMAVQNLWLTATAYDLGGYWSSPGFMTSAADDFLQLAPGERCYGLFYVAHHQAPDIPRERKTLASSVTWLEE